MMLKRLEEHEAKQQALFEEAKGKAEVPASTPTRTRAAAGPALRRDPAKRLSLMDARAQRKEAEEKRKAEEERKIKRGGGLA